ncbi:hypothetical protein [Bacillus cereus]|uniref:hypothetical protein n=1 Tax=Bacillus cereus TaxID=1396 RepID=UPI0030ED6096
MGIIDNDVFKIIQKQKNKRIYQISSDADNIGLVVTNNDTTVVAPLPTIPSDPNEPWLQEGLTRTDAAVERSDYAYVPIISIGDWVAVTVANSYGSIYNSGPYFGYFVEGIDFDLFYFDGVLVSFNDEEQTKKYNTMRKNKGEIAGYLGLKTKSSKVKPLLEGSTLNRVTKYSLLSSNVVDRNIGAHWSQAVSHGITETTTHTFAGTLGFSMTYTEGGFPLPASAQQQITASATYTFGSSNQISSGTTTTQTFDFARPGEHYKYSVYKYGVYQLNSTYKNNPAKPFNDFVSKLNDVFLTQGLYSYDLSQILSYVYDDDAYYAAQTKDPTPISKDDEFKIKYTLYYA